MTGHRASHSIRQWRTLQVQVQGKDGAKRRKGETKAPTTSHTCLTPLAPKPEPESPARLFKQRLGSGTGRSGVGLRTHVPNETPGGAGAAGAEPAPGSFCPSSLPSEALALILDTSLQVLAPDGVASRGPWRGGSISHSQPGSWGKRTRTWLICQHALPRGRIVVTTGPASLPETSSLSLLCS